MKEMLQESVYKLFAGQLEVWELARSNYEALDRVKVKTFDVGDSVYKVQFNPARATSSAAKVDPQSIKERKCFLCKANLPPQQEGIPFGEHYLVLVNPYPIFPRHLTIPGLEHTRQKLTPAALEDMLDLAAALTDFVIFYNGPECGASAPDHLHFQAGNKGFLPIEDEWRRGRAEQVAERDTASSRCRYDEPRAMLMIESTDRDAAVDIFNTVCRAMTPGGEDREPMMNVLAWYEEGEYIVCLFPRKKHRPACFFAEGEDNRLISPAAVDMGGVFITPLEKDFTKITASEIRSILEEVSLGKEEFHRLCAKIKELL